jgi:hypothetical protein
MKVMVLKFYKRHLFVGIAAALLFNTTNILAIITNDSRNDSYPVFTTLDPQTFLQTREKLRLMGLPVYVDHNEWFGVSLSPFGQNAQCALDDNNICIPIGDLFGRIDMIALLFGPTSVNGQQLPSILQTARNTLFPPAMFPPGTPINDPLYIDLKQEIGFFTTDFNYRKRGLRMDFKAQISRDFGISFDMGLADITQTVSFTDLTTTPTTDATSTLLPINSGCRELDYCCIEQQLMEQLQSIACALGYNIFDFHDFSIEDLRAGVYWRHAYPININRQLRWEPFLLIPWVHLEGSVPVGHERNYKKFAGLSFGSSDHKSIGLSTGLNIDFFRTIEVGGEVGVTHFFKHCVRDLPVPTSPYQQGLFPFSTAACIEPGNNYHFCLKMLAYHFLGDLSFHFQYVSIEHEKDCIKILNDDPAFLTFELTRRSGWRNQLANVGFNYDISPQISLGFLWQTPFPGRNVYRSSTVMLSFNAQY